MIKLKTDVENPSSSFETGVSSNFWNVFWKFISFFVFAATGIYSYSSGLLGLNTWWSLGIWYFTWLFVLISVIISMNNYKKIFEKELDNSYFLDFGDIDDDPSGCFGNIFLLLFFPIAYPLNILFISKSYKELANRFVCYDGKYFLFDDNGEKANVYEIESYNPFFLFWINLFRGADSSDAHVKIINKALMEKEDQEDVLELDPQVLKEFKKEMSDFLDLEFKNKEDTFLFNEDNFIEYMRNEKGDNFSKGMELYARKIHKEKIVNLNSK